jgi:deoxyribodipyrimidine photolyase-like uncharacterized protein
MKQAAWILGDQLSLKNSALQQLNSQNDIVALIYVSWFITPPS